MKYSRQRELVREVVLTNKIHPTADKVYNMLHEENPNISLATVYRNLNLLAHEGVIAKITTPYGGDRFDGDVTEHYHMICTACGEVFDSSISLLNEIDEKVKSITGFHVQSHQLILYGICENCSGLVDADENITA